MILTGNKDWKSFSKLKNVIKGQKIIFTTFFSPSTEQNQFLFYCHISSKWIKSSFSSLQPWEKKKILILLAAGGKIIELLRGQHSRCSTRCVFCAFTSSCVINIHLYGAACRILTVNVNEHALTLIYANRKQQTREWQIHFFLFFTQLLKAQSV